MTQQFHFGVYTLQIESKVLKRYLYTHVHSSIILNSQKMNAMKVHPYSGILFSLKKEGNSDAGYMNEP